MYYNILLIPVFFIMYTPTFSALCLVNFMRVKRLLGISEKQCMKLLQELAEKALQHHEFLLCFSTGALYKRCSTIMYCCQCLRSAFTEWNLSARVSIQLEWHSFPANGTRFWFPLIFINCPATSTLCPLDLSTVFSAAVSDVLTSALASSCRWHLLI